jgi:predicted transcriptional regulator
MRKCREHIIEMLRGCPNGLTTREVAERLGETPGNISSKLSKLAAYGIIAKARGRITRDGSRGAVYRALSDEDCGTDALERAAANSTKRSSEQRLRAQTQ